MNPGGSPHAQYVVVGDVGAEALLTYNLGTASTLNSGNLAPTYNNHSTTLHSPFFIFNDYQSNLWAGNFSGASVTWYSVTGNGTPTAHTVSGANTTLGCPTGVYVDPKGNLYVADPCSTHGTPSIDLFASSGSPASPPTGNVAPTAWVGGATTTLSDPQGLTVDSSGNIWVIDSGTTSVHEFSALAAGSGQNDVAPIGSLTSSSLEGPLELYVDHTKHLWIADSDAGNGSLFEFNLAVGAQTPVCTISGSNTGISAPGGQISVAVDSGGYVYAVHNGTAAIYIFSPGQCGNPTPAYTISGASTDMVEPSAIVVYSTSTDY